MGKVMSEMLKITISSILSILMTIVVLSGTVIGKKADKEYVDKQDDKIETHINKIEADYQRKDQELKADYLRQATEIKESQKTMQEDIKKILQKL